MSKALKRLALGLTVLMAVICTSLTAFAGDQGGGDSGSGGSGTAHGNAGYYPDVYGLTINILPRQDLLTYASDNSYGVNPSNPYNYRWYNGGITFLLKDETKELVTSGYSELTYNQNLDRRNATLGQSWDDLEYLFPGSSSSLRYGIEQIVSEYVNLAKDNNAHFRTDEVAARFNWAISDTNGNWMLYKPELRRQFYRRFASLVGTPSISEEEFMSNTGCLVIYPVIGYEKCRDRGSNIFMTFPQAWEINSSPLDGDKEKIINNTLFCRKYSYNVAALGKSVTTKPMTWMGSLTNKVDIVQTPVSNDVDTASILKQYEKSFKYNIPDGYRQGFAVYGLDWGGESKGASSLTVRATQNDDGSYSMDAKTSTISEENGNMAYTDSLDSCGSDGSELWGGQSEYKDWGGAPARVSNQWEAYTNGYKTWGYGAYLLYGSGTYDAYYSADNARQAMQGTTDAKVTSVNSGDFNGGNTYKPQYYYRTPEDAAQYVAQSQLGGGVATRLKQDMIDLDATPMNIIYNLTALANNNSKTGVKDLWSTSNWNTAGGGTIDMNSSEHRLGLAVEYLYNSKPIKSYITYATITYDKNLKPSLSYGGSGDCYSKDHTLEEEAKFEINRDNYYIALVPNGLASSYQLSDSNACGGSFWEIINSHLKDGSIYELTDFRKDVQDTLYKDSIVNEGTSNGATASVGGNNGKGYSIFVLEVKTPDTIEVESDVMLQDYQLNNISMDILASRNGLLTNSGEGLATTDNVKYAWCPITGEYHEDYNTTYAYSLHKVTKLQKGTTIDAHRKSAEPLLLYNQLLGNSYTFNTIDAGIRDLDTTTPTRYTYALNLSRGLHGDVRTISALSRNSISKEDMDVLTGVHKHTLGVTPSVVEEVEQKRNSDAIYKNEVADKFVFESLWKERYPYGVAKKTHSGIVDSADGKVYTECTYEELKSSGAKPLKYNGISIYNLEVKLKERVNKYSTVAMDMGKNSLVDNDLNGGTVGDVIQSEASKEDSILIQPYKHAVVSKLMDKDGNPYTLKFYPEVRMRAYFTNGADTLGQGTIKPKTIITMAEQIRKVEPSSLYLLRVDNNSEAGNEQAKGTIHSDTMATGSNAKDASKNKGNKPVIYGGSDITLDVKSGFDIEMFGYALDLINYDKDKDGFKIGADSNEPYKNIVNDTSEGGRDPYTTWGNGEGTGETESTQRTKSQFEEWANNVKNSLAVDISLDVSKDSSSNNSEVVKSFNNFNTSLASSDKAITSEDDGVFSLYVRRGELDKESVGYKALITAISNDYNCKDDKEASDLFEKSDIYQSIAKAVEDTKDDFNKSQKVNTEENGAHAVRTEDTDAGWYDEEVKTFVVRRYKAETVHIGDVILSDKLDYNLAPDSNAGKTNKSNAQQGSYSSHEGKWYMTVYFNDNAKAKGSTHKDGTNLYITEQELYNPKNGEVDTGANYYKGGNVLVNRLHIAGADFLIPSATTSDMLK